MLSDVPSSAASEPASLAHCRCAAGTEVSDWTLEFKTFIFVSPPRRLLSLSNAQVQTVLFSPEGLDNMRSSRREIYATKSWDKATTETETRLTSPKHSTHHYLRRRSMLDTLRNLLPGRAPRLGRRICRSGQFIRVHSGHFQRSVHLHATARGDIPNFDIFACIIRSLPIFLLFRRFRAIIVVI